jgi:hypothetical protein
MSTGFMTVCLGMISPYLLPLMTYDYYLLIGFSSLICNRTIHEIILANNKYDIIVNKCNFLGFETAKMKKIKIRDIKYTGEVVNNYMSFDHTGLPPSISKLLSLTGEVKTNPISGEIEVNEKDKNTFKHFTSFMADNEKYLIPLDNDNFKKSVIAEDLLLHIVNGRQRAVLNFDYSAIEEEAKKYEDNLTELKEMFDD